MIDSDFLHPDVPRDGVHTCPMPRSVAADIAAMISQMGGGARMPIFRATVNGKLRLFLYMSGELILPEALECPGKTLVVLCDYPPFGNGMPDFPMAKYLLHWANRILVHGAEVDISDYDSVVRHTVTSKRYLLIETTSANFPRWYSAAELLKHPGAGVEAWSCKPGVTWEGGGRNRQGSVQ